MAHSRKNRKNRRRSQLPAPRTDYEIAGRGDESRPASATTGTATAITQTSFELRKGPIPDAEELIRYGHAHPDAPDIILREFQAQASHRRSMERRDQALGRKAMDASIISERLGLACALLIALVGFACGTYLIATGHGVEGTIVFGLDVGALVSAFILGRPKNGQEQ